MKPLRCLYHRFIPPISTGTVHLNHPDLQTGLARNLLLTALKVGVRVTDRPGDSVEGETGRLGGELDLGADVEESKVAGDEVVGDAGCFVLVACQQTNRLSIVDARSWSKPAT